MVFTEEVRSIRFVYEERKYVAPTIIIIIIKCKFLSCGVLGVGIFVGVIIEKERCVVFIYIYICIVQINTNIYIDRKTRFG